MDERGVVPAYRIETDRLVLRCYDLTDAPALKRAVDEDRDHLLPWLPWAAESLTEQETLDLLRKFRGWFDLDQDYIYGIFDRGDGRYLGGSGLHPRSSDASSREIGYWIRRDHEGQGLITETVAALTRVGFEHGALDRIEIHCATGNQRSLAVPRRLGYSEEGTLARRLKDANGRVLDMVVFTMFASDFAGSACAQTHASAYDGLGVRMSR